MLIVEEIEKSLPFWKDRMGSKTVDVPEGDRVGFVRNLRQIVETQANPNRPANFKKEAHYPLLRWPLTFRRHSMRSSLICRSGDCVLRGDHACLTHSRETLRVRAKLFRGESIWAYP